MISTAGACKLTRVKEKQQTRHSGIWTEQQLEQLHRLYALRSQVAGFAARQAAQRVSEGASVAELEQCHRQMCASAQLGDYQAFLDADMQFHHAIAELADMPALLAMWKVMEREMKPFAGWGHRALFHDLEMIARAHVPQLETILHGDGDAAERAAHVDLDALWYMLAEQPAELTAEPDAIERACAYVLMNLHRKITLAQVAHEVAHLSASHFNKLFRERRGEAFGTYVQNLRLRRAEALLQEGIHDIHEISVRVGYTDTSRFGEHFKRRYGHPPSDYKRHTISPQ